MPRQWHLDNQLKPCLADLVVVGTGQDGSDASERVNGEKEASGVDAVMRIAEGEGGQRTVAYLGAAD